MTDEQIARKLDLMSAETDKALAEIYARARVNIKSELSWYYEKYANGDGILTYAEMSKYNRLVNLNAFLENEMRILGKAVDDEIKTLVKETYESAFFEYGNSIVDQYAGAYGPEPSASISFSQPRADDLRSLINEPNVSGTSLADTLSVNRYNALLYERQTITQGLLQGETYVKMAKRIQDATEKSFNDSLRIARTEAGRAQSEGQARAYDEAEEQGIEIVKTWVARHRNTRPEHNKLDGTHPDKNGYWYSTDPKTGKKAKTRYPHGFGVAGLDINCFCVVTAQLKKD